MNNLSPIAYLRKQKKIMATASLLVAGMQVFGYNVFINKENQRGQKENSTNYSSSYFPGYQQELPFPYNLNSQKERVLPSSEKIISEKKGSEIPEANQKIISQPTDKTNPVMRVTSKTRLKDAPKPGTGKNNPTETIRQGIIGKSELYPIDDPSDNIFTVSLAKKGNETEETFLVYELFGLSDASGASISINDEFARGGFVVKKNKEWTTQRQRIDVKTLHEGDNSIRFSTLAPADYQYMVKNVRIESEDIMDEQGVIFHQTELKAYDGHLYLSGFVNELEGSLIINGQEVKIQNNRFEIVMNEVKNEILVTANGEERSIPVINIVDEAPDEIISLDLPFGFVEKTFSNEMENNFHYGGAALFIPAGSLEKETIFFMSALRYQDLSVISPEMVNVTGNYSGFRLLPHGEHFVNAPATLEIPYDETKIPAGYQPKDIKTFYFDDAQRKWIALERDTVLTDKKVIVSKTSHFTDFVNGVIKVPESPETGSFTPTSIKDIKAADPASGIVSIPPPTPNNMGTANTSFPIKLPAGRGGMQPSLSVNYNSEGGNGWMGIGWDLSVPSISIDTRWGAPRYDPHEETEIYSMAGEMLTMQVGSDFTNPHRTSNITRSSDRIFYPRKEDGSYLNIKRHGSNPTNYWWEVTDKMGNKNFYGGYNGAVVPNAVIKTADGNIAHWALYRTEDTNGNYVQYTYETINYTETGPGNGGKEFYLKRIDYTLNKDESPAAYYKVDFIRNAYSVGTGNFTERKDININARLGLVQVVSDNLTEIRIDYVFKEPQRIRTYRFDYRDPNFSKQQLTKISEYDANDDLFYYNTLEYYSEVTDGGFMASYGESTTQWSTNNDNTDGGLILSGLSGDFNDKGSILGASKGWGFSGSAAINVGLGFDIFSKMAAAGVNFGYGYSQDNGLVSFADINGDGLPDKIIKEGNSSVKYRPNNGSGFDGLVTIDDLSDFSRSSSNTFNVGIEANFGVFLGYTYSKSKNKLKTYFSDVNGDGLVDLVNNGRVSFNSNELFIDPNDPNYNIRKFFTSSGYSPNQIEAGAINGDIQDILQPINEEEILQNENPLHDVVKVWVAPRDGNYTINSSTVTLNPLVLPDDNDEYKADYDGVIVRIEKGNTSNNDLAADIIPDTTRELTPLYNELTDEVTFGQSTTIPSKSLSLNKGQRIYFRVHSKEEGSYDRVEWNPSVTYTGSDPNDANGFPYFSSSASEGFIVSDNGGIPIPENADVSINFPQFSVAPYTFSDNIRLSMIIGTLDPETGEYGPQTYGFYININQANNYNNLTASDFGNFTNYLIPGRTIWFKVESDSNIDWKLLSSLWKPEVIIDDTPIKSIVEYGIYNKKINDGAISRLSLPLPYNRALRLSMLYNSQAIPLDYLDIEPNIDKCYKVNLVVKDINKKVIGKKLMGAKVVPGSIPIGILAKKVQLYNTASCTGTLTTLSISSSLPTPTIFTEINVEEEDLAIMGIFRAKVEQRNTGNTAWNEIATKNDVYAKDGNGIFGPEYRNWGQFAYRSQGGLSGINETVLAPPSTDQDNAPTEDPFSGCIDSEGEYDDECVDQVIEDMGIQNPMDAPFIMMIPNPNKEIAEDEIYLETYDGYDNDIYVEEGAFSSSRMGINNIQSILIDFDIEPQAVPGVTIISKGEGDSEVAGAGPIGGSWSQSFNYKVNEFTDMNGDRYPDIITENKIQYTSSTGKLDETKDFEFGRASTSENEVSGSSVAGTFLFANTGSSNSLTLHSIGTSSANFPALDPKTAPQPNSSASLSYNSSSGSNEEHLLWIDMNGDGLPDRVRIEDGPLTVQLNLGYGFDDPQQWENAPAILSGTSRNDSGGAGFSILNNSWGGGVSASTSRGYTNENFVDISGDGLPDLILNPGGEIIHYRLNSGNGFGDDLYSISKAVAQSNRSTAEGANGAFTFGITGIFVKATTSISASVNHSLNRVESTISDIDGDGYADLLYTASNSHDGDLKARLNKTGKTHLLKKVYTPLGGSWEIDYHREGNTYEMPQSKWVLDTIKTYDGFHEDHEFTPDETLTTVKYYKGKHDRREREFLGFEAVQVNQHNVLENDDVYRFSLQEFHNNLYYLKGALKNEALYDASALEPDDTFDFSASHIPWVSTETTYAIMERGETDPGETVEDSDHVFVPADFDAAIDKTSLFVSPIRTTKKFTEGGTGLKETYTEILEFDANGNIKKYFDEGEGSGDEVTTEINYLNNATFRGLPTSIKVKAGGTTLRERNAEYNTSNGNLVAVVTKLNSSESAFVTFDYDPYGNIEKVTHENSVDENDNPFFYEYTYDDKVHTYPVKVEDAFGYSSNNTYDYRFGALVFTEDMNYMPMRTRIDDRGRVVEITGPYELFVEGLTTSDPAWTIRFEYENEATVAELIAHQELEFTDYVIDARGSFIPDPTHNPDDNLHHAVTRHFDPEFREDPETPLTNNEIYTVTLIDGLGKPVQVKKSTSIKTAVTNPSGDITPAVIDARETRKWLINGKVYTDAFGRAKETYYPILEDFTDPDNPVSWQYNATPYETGEDFYTQAEYDVLDRVTKTTLPGEDDFMSTEYAIDTNLFKTTVTNEKGQVKHSFTDIRGRTTKVVEESIAEGNIETLFEYNAIGELLKVTDADDNETESFYDMAGRRIELRHPDNGITKFTYDNASNLIAKETSNLLADGNGEKIEYSYTFNRLDSIVYPQHPHNNVHFFYGAAQDASAADDFSVGRLWYQIDATGVQQFKYGRLGEVRYNLRSVAVPGDKAYWFKTEWEYDTWNRVKKIVYPDEEEVTYFYNRGGELHAITSKKEGQQNDDIISQLGYDKFGQRMYLRYGNGAETNYEYEQDRRRLRLMAVNNDNRAFMVNRYDYDVLSNVTQVTNVSPLPTTGQIGGTVDYTYEYDDLNRLTTATGLFTGRNAADDGYEQQQYALRMHYDNLHNITSKEQFHQKAPGQSGGTFTDIPATTYRLDYQDDANGGYGTAEYNVAGYQYTQPHAPRKIIDKPYPTSTGNDVKTKLYDYDENGNLTHITQTTGESETVEKLRTNLWDEENRLRAVDITPDAEGVRPIAIYTYDAGGERILKHSNTSASIYLNGKKVADTIQTDATLYPSGMTVFRPSSGEEGGGSYTKHYYAGTQRVSSKIGTTENLGDFLQDWITQGMGGPVDAIGSSMDVLTNAEEGVVQVYTELGIDPPTYESSPTFIPVESFTHGDEETEQYWFHPDHLGSTSYITNVLGEVSQHMEYFAFGETFVEEHRSSNNSPYKFNGKELDEETGWYYYGARYYDPRVSVWLSVDPLAEQTMTPYQYCYQNPVNLIDYMGMKADPPTDFNGDIWKDETGTYTKTGDFTYTQTDDHGNILFEGYRTDATQLDEAVISNAYDNYINHRYDYLYTGQEDYMAAAIPFAIYTSAQDGPLPVGEIVGATTIAAAGVASEMVRVHVTYTLVNDEGKIYVGRTSGFNTPYNLVMARYSGHHMRLFGYKNPTIDRAAIGIQGRLAIRGREQQLTDFYGGVGSATSGNRIRPVSKYNPLGTVYHNASSSTFGEIHEFTGYNPLFMSR